MNINNLYKVERKDVERCVTTLKDAFRDDPLWREVFRDDPNKDQALTGFYTMPILYGLKFGKVFAPSAGIEGVAVWLPGEKSFMGFLGLLRCGALSCGAKFGKSTMNNLSRLGKHLVPDRKRHMKDKKYTYLLIIGVKSEHQGKGYGGALLKKIVAECDESNRYLYLETESEGTAMFYEKHGFNTVQKINVDRINVPMWEMARPPQ
jgi:ribosomal protein S18 acetylase RimI-like enzyme